MPLVSESLWRKVLVWSLAGFLATVALLLLLLVVLR